MEKKWASILFIALWGLVLANCGSSTPPGPEVKTSAIDVAKPVPRAAGEQKWDALLVEAKKEGEVLIYTNVSSRTRELLSKTFRDKYGINLDFVTLSSGAEVFSRAASEKRAGVKAADVFVTGSTNLVNQFKPEGLLAPIEPKLVLPEVLDPKVWRGGRLAFTDKDKLIFDLIGAVSLTYLVNTEAIKEGEITSFLDVLKPAYKGKITLADPLVPGTSNSLMAYLGHIVYGMDKTADFLRQLMKQEPAIIRDRRVHVEWVARGRYAIGIGPDTKETAAFMDLGAPIALVWPKEGSWTSSMGGSLGIHLDSPHPNAAAVFVNWLLTKEGQTLFSQGFGFPGTRMDITSEVNPKILPPADVKVFVPSLEETEEWIRKQGRMAETTRQILTPLLK